MIFHWIAVIVVKIAFVYNSFWVSPVAEEPVIQPVSLATTTPEVRVEVVQSPVLEQPKPTITTEPSPTVPFTVVVYATTTSVQEVPQPVSNPAPTVIAPVVVTEVPLPPQPCTLTAHISEYTGYGDPYKDEIEWSPSVSGSHLESTNSYGGLNTYLIDGEKVHLPGFNPDILPTSDMLATQSTTTHGHQGYYHLIQPNGVECFAKTI